MNTCQHTHYHVMKEVKYGNRHEQEKLCKDCGNSWTYVLKTENTWNERIGPISKQFSNGEGHCRKCETTWAYVQDHVTMYAPNLGFTALCKLCWSELTPKERLPYYRELWENQYKNTSDKKEMKRLWPLIEQAVLNEE